MSLLKELELHFETRQEYIKAGNEKRMADEKERMKISYEALKLNFANNTHESHSKILKELQMKGFKISNKYKSSFTDDELDLYYKNSERIWAFMNLSILYIFYFVPISIFMVQKEYY